MKKSVKKMGELPRKKLKNSSTNCQKNRRKNKKF
jgi:hypothetical protein